MVNQHHHRDQLSRGLHCIFDQKFRIESSIGPSLSKKTRVFHLYLKCRCSNQIRSSKWVLVLCTLNVDRNDAHHHRRPPPSFMVLLLIGNVMVLFLPTNAAETSRSVTIDDGTSQSNSTKRLGLEEPSRLNLTLHRIKEIWTNPVKPEKLNLMIGSRGKKVKSISEETGVDSIVTQDNGIVKITARDLVGLEKSKAIINNQIMEKDPSVLLS